MCVAGKPTHCKCGPCCDPYPDRVCSQKGVYCNNVDVFPTGVVLCAANASQTGGCDPADGNKFCQCRPGSVRASDGSCVDYCNTSPDCSASAHGVGSCTSFKGCDCAAGYGNAANGTCVNICAVVAAASYCSDNSDGTCVANTGCKCTIGYVPDADGKCTVNVCTTSPDCTTNTSANNHSTDFKGCDCAAGYINVADGTCENVCNTLTVATDCADSVGGVATAKCTDFKGCDCAEGYGNAADGTCVDICTAIDVFAVCDKDKDEYSDGVCTPLKGCNCSDYHENDDDGTCKLITSNCDGNDCTASESQTGKCNTAGDGCACQSGFVEDNGTCARQCGTVTCNANDLGTTGACGTSAGTCACDTSGGYVNAISGANIGQCAEGTVCAGGRSCDNATTDDRAGLCTRNDDTKCKCNADHLNSPVSGDCVSGGGCTDSVKCTGSVHTGTCVIGDLDTCICSDPITHAAGDAGTCELITSNCGGKDCDASESQTGQCNTTGDGCACQSGFVEDNGTCVNACGTSCDAAKDGYTGTCLTILGKPSCECSANYLNDDINPLLCTLSCAECGANTNGQCTNPEGVLTCGCKDGFKVTSSNPKICENACGTNCPIENDVYVGTCTMVGGSASCVCKTGHKHDPSNPFTCVSGSPCEGVTCKIETGYKGTCEEDRGFAHCPCADKYTNTEDLTICTLNCSACTDTNAVAGCTLVGNTLTCNCKTGYVNGADPLTCTAVTTTTTSTVSVTLPGLPVLTTTSAAAEQSCTFISLTVAMFVTAIILNRF